MTSGRLPLYLVALIAAVAALTQARAAPLDGETCAKLESEQSQLENAGIAKEMAKGPAWAKANLAPEKLERVRRFIEIQEQLLFLCRKGALINLQDDDDDKEAAADKNKAAPKAGEATSAPTNAKSAAPKQGEPKQKQPAANPAAQPKKADAGAAKKAPPAAEPGVTSIEKRPAKPKADDAFKAPPPDPAVNPFADQIKRPAKE